MFCRPRPILFTCAAGALLGLPNAGLAAEAAYEVPASTTDPANPSDSGPSASEIPQLVADLDDNQYERREHAQEQLTASGLLALDRVARVAQKGSLESSTRALNILLEWSESRDTPLAIAALERLAQLDNRPREAQYASQLLGDLHERQALEQLVELGAAFRSSRYAVVVNRLPVSLNLHILIGKDWKGGNEGFRLLREVPRISQLSLYSPPVDEQVIDDLVSLPHLQRVELFGTSFSPNGIDRVRSRVVGQLNGTVDVREGAFLGISGKDLNASAIVVQVVPGGAAEKAGILPGDVITHFGGKPVNSFLHLTELIGERREGDSARLTVLRDPNGRLQAQVRRLQRANPPALRIRNLLPQAQPVPNQVPANPRVPANRPVANPPPAARPAAPQPAAPQPAAAQAAEKPAPAPPAEEEGPKVMEMTVTFDRWSLTGQQALTGQTDGVVNDLPINELPRPHHERR